MILRRKLPAVNGVHCPTELGAIEKVLLNY